MYHVNPYQTIELLQTEVARLRLALEQEQADFIDLTADCITLSWQRDAWKAAAKKHFRRRDRRRF